MRLCLVADEPIQAIGLKACLESAGGVEFKSRALRELLELPEALPGCDILLIDFTPAVTFAALGQVIQCAESRAVMLWTDDDIPVEFAFQAMGLGVRGILRKTLPAELQVRVFEKVFAGEPWFEKSLTDGFLTSRRVELSPRDGQLITLLSYGCSNKEIAATLLINEGTVKVYLSRLFTKVKVHDRYELALYGMRNLSPRHLEIREHPLKPRNLTVPKPILSSLVIKPRPAAEAKRVFALKPAPGGRRGRSERTVDDERWDRIYKEKFEDPSYYSRPGRGTNPGSSLNQTP